MQAHAFGKLLPTSWHASYRLPEIRPLCLQATGADRLLSNKTARQRTPYGYKFSTYWNPCRSPISRCKWALCRAFGSPWRQPLHRRSRPNLCSVQHARERRRTHPAFTRRQQRHPRHNTRKI